MAHDRLEEIRKNRLQKRERLIQSGADPYPAEVRTTHSLYDALATFDTLVKESSPIVLAGRIVSIRKHGGLTFADISDATGQIQIQVTRDDVHEDIYSRIAFLDEGDWVQITGKPSVTQRGEKTVITSEFHIIAKSIRPIPSKLFGLKDQEAKYRNREIDIWLNQTVRMVFLARAKIVGALRAILEKHEFVEVETPVLQPLAGGALAHPFSTHHNALDEDLYLRIAPELYLKRLLVGGFHKVYELGRNFRNEGISLEHNPEFTMLELYWRYADYEDLMDFGEEVLETLSIMMFGVPQCPWSNETLSFKRPLEKKRFVEIMSEKLEFDILEEHDVARYRAYCDSANISRPVNETYGKYIDTIFKKIIRPTLIQPTILFDYPSEMVPLAKCSKFDQRIVEKFQIIVGGMELINAYTELNDPVEQRRRFEQQKQALLSGDGEAHEYDEEYIRSLEYGLPPCGGLGMGIDRLVMLFTNTGNMRDTILFPILRQKING